MTVGLRGNVLLRVFLLFAICYNCFTTCYYFMLHVTTIVLHGYYLSLSFITVLFHLYTLYYFSKSATAFLPGYTRVGTVEKVL